MSPVNSVPSTAADVIHGAITNFSKTPNSFSRSKHLDLKLLLPSRKWTFHSWLSTKIPQQFLVFYTRFKGDKRGRSHHWAWPVATHQGRDTVFEPFATTCQQSWQVPCKWQNTQGTMPHFLTYLDSELWGGVSWETIKSNFCSLTKLCSRCQQTAPSPVHFPRKTQPCLALWLNNKQKSHVKGASEFLEEQHWMQARTGRAGEAN